MKIKTILLLTAIATAATLADIPQYNIIPLGKLTDNPEEITKVFSINDTGQIVGMNSFDHNDTVSTPMLYRYGQYENPVNLSPGKTYEGSVVVLNNNAGQIIGFNSGWFTNYDSSGQGRNVTIDVGQSFIIGELLSINDAGQVPLNSSSKAAVLHTSPTVDLTIFDVPQKFRSSYAIGINNAGQAVGTAMDDDSIRHAMLFEKDKVTDLGTLGGKHSYATAINNKGQIVGYATDASGVQIATIFDPTGQGNNSPLRIDGHEGGIAFSINDQGWVVGLTADGYNSFDGAFLFDGNNAVDIQKCLPTDSGWNIDVAWDINNLNQIIGWGKYNGQQHAFLMTPVPEPATLTILAIGTLLIRRRKNT